MNLSTVGKLNFVPTRSKVCEKQPISIISGYILDSVRMATPFTEARSCLAARSSVKRAEAKEYDNDGGWKCSGGEWKINEERMWK